MKRLTSFMKKHDLGSIIGGLFVYYAIALVGLFGYCKFVNWIVDEDEPLFLE